MFTALAHVGNRRKALRARFDVARQMEAIEETCIPSYLHSNPAAAGTAWARLFVAARIHRNLVPTGPVLDFGAAAGELAHILPNETRYDFVESDDAMANALQHSKPDATRRTIASLQNEKYAAIFALDSLEHNENVGELLDMLIPTLRRDGVFILSGPTENALYRIGRRIAGFNGGYHHTNIHNIEAMLGTRLKRLGRMVVPFGLPLFSLTWWGR